MWTISKSIFLSRICVIIFMVALLAVAVFAPWLASRMFDFSSEAGPTYFLLTVYAGSVPAAFLLISLFCILSRIEKGKVFIKRNVSSLRHISWCCFAGAVVCAASSFYYISWIMVAVAAAFMGLIVRVVKNVFSQAVSLQDDADFTI